MCLELLQSSKCRDKYIKVFLHLNESCVALVAGMKMIIAHHHA